MCIQKKRIKKILRSTFEKSQASVTNVIRTTTNGWFFSAFVIYMYTLTVVMWRVRRPNSQPDILYRKSSWTLTNPSNRPILSILQRFYYAFLVHVRSSSLSLSLLLSLSSLFSSSVHCRCRGHCRRHRCPRRRYRLTMGQRIWNRNDSCLVLCVCWRIILELINETR